MFGLIVVLTFTASISIVEGDRAATGTILLAALACNLAWGVVDAAMFLISRFAERARERTTLRAVRGTDASGAVRSILAGLPPAIADALTPPDLEALRRRLIGAPDPPDATVTRADFIGAAGVCLLVFCSTLPVVVPFIVLHDTAVALRISNAIAVLMLFVLGWSLGRYTGRPPWRAGLSMVMLGVALVVLTIALGG